MVPVAMAIGEDAIVACSLCGGEGGAVKEFSEDCPHSKNLQDKTIRMQFHNKDCKKHYIPRMLDSREWWKYNQLTTKTISLKGTSPLKANIAKNKHETFGT